MERGEGGVTEDTELGPRVVDDQGWIDPWSSCDSLDTSPLSLLPSLFRSLFPLCSFSFRTLGFHDPLART